jgi:hypothetical protein
MPFVWAMWIAWAVFVVFMAAMYLYRSILTKNEDDQIFLDDSFEQEKAEQAAIAAKVAKVDPLVRVSWRLVIAVSTLVIVYYVRDILVKLDVIG